MTLTAQFKKIDRSTVEAVGEGSRVARLQEQLEKEKERYKKLWSLNCTQLVEFDGTISAKDEEIERLKSRLHNVSDESSLPRGSPLKHPWKVRQRMFYPPIREEEPLLWKCLAEKIVKILLMIGYLLWCK